MSQFEELPLQEKKNLKQFVSIFNQFSCNSKFCCQPKTLLQLLFGKLLNKITPATTEKAHV